MAYEMLKYIQRHIVTLDPVKRSVMLAKIRTSLGTLGKRQDWIWAEKFAKLRNQAKRGGKFGGFVSWSCFYHTLRRFNRICS